MIKFLLDPFNIFLIIAGATIASKVLNLEKLFRFYLFLSFSFFLVISTPFVPNRLLGSLEGRYTPIIAEEFSETRKMLPYHIVVLGGGHGYDNRLPANSLLSLQALARLTEGVRLYQAFPNSKLVLSGYSASGRVPQAEMLKRTALLLGVDSDRIITQSEPGNTTDEAKVYSEKFGDTVLVILVTSAAHMPRAVGAFSRFGIETIPSPTNYRIKKERKMKWIGWPSTSNISKLQSALYEYAAIERDLWLQ